MAELISGLRDDHAVQVIGGRAVLSSARLPHGFVRLGQRRFDGPARRHLLQAALPGDLGVAGRAGPGRGGRPCARRRGSWPTWRCARWS